MPRIEGQLPNLNSTHFPTGYGPWPYVNDTTGIEPIARVNMDPTALHHDCERIPGTYHGWTRCFRIVDLPRLADECRGAGVDPESVILTIFDGPYVPTTWVQTEEDADRLRLAWARAANVSVEHAQEGVTSPHISEDQRAMYQAILRDDG